MKYVEVYLPTPTQVQKFVGTLVALKGDFELISDNQILDARSLMGIFGFDLSKPIKLKIHNDSPENLKAIAPFIAGGAADI